MLCETCRMELPASATACPRCGVASRPDSWSLVARVSNLAEAGFLCDQLEQAGIPCELVTHEDVSALDGQVQRVYGVRVAAADAARAAQLLRLETSVPPPAGWEDEDSPGLALAVRLPIVAVIIAVTLSVLATLQAPARRPRPPQPRSGGELWKALQQSPPLTSADRQLRIRYDAAQEAIVLERRLPDGGYRPQQVFGY